MYFFFCFLLFIIDPVWYINKIYFLSLRFESSIIYKLYNEANLIKHELEKKNQLDIIFDNTVHVYID